MKKLFLFLLIVTVSSAANAMKLWNGALSTETNVAALTTSSSAINSYTLTDRGNTQISEDTTQPKEVSSSSGSNGNSTDATEITPQKSIFDNSFNILWRYFVSDNDDNFGERSMYGFYGEFFFWEKSGIECGLNFGASTNLFIVDPDYQVYGSHICPEIGIGFNESNTSGLIVPLGLGIYYTDKVYCTFEFLPHFSFKLDKVKIDVGCWLTVNEETSTSIYLAVGF